MCHVADLILDCSGLACPLPVVRTALAMRQLPVGQVLELLATDPAAEPDIQAWARLTGNELLGITRSGDVVHVLIRRTR